MTTIAYIVFITSQLIVYGLIYSQGYKAGYTAAEEKAKWGDITSSDKIK